MSYAVTGYDPQGRSAYYRRNLSLSAAIEAVAAATASGWTGVMFTREVF